MSEALGNPEIQSRPSSPFRLRSRLWTILVVCLVIVGLTVVHTIVFPSATVSAEAHTFSGYMNSMPTPRNLRLVETQHGVMLIAIGPPARLLPSGPPVYVFNQGGILVDWCHDIGDSSRFKERWGWLPALGKPISVEEAYAWLQDSKK